MTETKAVIETKYGNMEMSFFTGVAPKHVSNFIELAEKGFYDEAIFHRVIPGFMIQGGDPNTKDSDRSRHGMDSARFQVVYPVLPMDLLGIYILLPDGGRP